MDAMTRLKTKIGENEFEAEGSPEYVREQFLAWQELVKLTAATPKAPADNSGGASDRRDEVKNDQTNVEPDLTKILRTDGRYISLTAQVPGVHDAVLALLYGQKALRNNDSVTGAELLSGLAATGGFGNPRLDRILDKLADDGDVMAFGERRGKRYRLTNTGIAKARALAQDLIKAVA